VSLQAQLNQLKGRVADFLFPPHCLGCGKEGDFLCIPCRRALPRLLPPLCPRCSRPLIQEDRCPICQRWRLEINGIRSPLLFQGVVRQAIHQLKYNNFKVLASPLAQLLAEYVETRPLPVEVIVPVPLHPRRLRERGYNQSALLARELGRLISLPVVEDSLFRLKDTPAQARASNAEIRRSNVVGVFACRDEKLKGKQVLLIDDVCTTGATLDSCAITLNRAGASSVWGLALAREV
jgi:competence protein ComFC